MKNVERLKTVTGEELMNEPLRPPNFVVNSLLSQGLHILAGAPKVGKSWLAVTVAKGEPVWGMSVRQGTTLYLCLEDSTLRIQNRLFEITEDAPANDYFCTESRVVGAGLEEQLETFLTEHPDTLPQAAAKCCGSKEGGHRSRIPPEQRQAYYRAHECR